MIPIGVSSRPLAPDEVVRHGDGLVVHTTRNETPADDLLDDVNAYIVGEVVPRPGILLGYRTGSEDDGRIWMFRLEPDIAMGCREGTQFDGRRDRPASA